MNAGKSWLLELLTIREGEKLMEHIIQFGVTIDEKKIIDHATSRASNEIYKKVEKEISKYTSGWQDTRLDQLFREEIRKVIYDNKDKILEDAITRVAQNLTRTKAVKDMLHDMEVWGLENE